jgi:hypothetical protein
MQALFTTEAVNYGVLPIDDRGVACFDSSLARWPDLTAGRTSLTVYEACSSGPAMVDPTNGRWNCPRV